MVKEHMSGTQGLFDGSETSNPHIGELRETGATDPDLAGGPKRKEPQMGPPILPRVTPGPGRVSRELIFKKRHS